MKRGFSRRLGCALRLAAAVLADVLRSNIAVARIILRPGGRRRAGFVAIPLALRNADGLAALACIITATPGTAWASFDSARGVLRIHVLDLDDEQTLIRSIQERYEKRLKEIFE